MNYIKKTDLLLIFLVLALVAWPYPADSQNKLPREYGIKIGIMSPGPQNSITDVSGVQVGQRTLYDGDSIRTGVTAIRPHGGNIFREKVPAGVYVSNGFGKLTGTTQIKELGNLETPIILTNTLSVPTAADAIISHTLSLENNENVQSVNPVVGETNDGWLNDIRDRHIKEKHVLDALKRADSDMVKQGVVGAGTGTTAFGYKGGIGTASRELAEQLGGYTVGVLVQTNFGGVLQIDGVPVGEELGQYSYNSIYEKQAEGSCMIIVATNAPLTARNLERLAKRATFGLARTGGFGSNGSGDYAIAFSTHPEVRITDHQDSKTRNQTVLRNSAISPLFLAAVEATEEAIINSMFAATDTEGKKGHSVSSLPVPKVLEIMENHGHSIEKP